ncbi:hypothetical protein [Dolichospermum sp. UHCC 0259]|uniref:hypothetical protein n=1 Tax=Dolichospermum sp. UHCC 0259 TaxID=2590010 RepID=UPI0014468053|nr:hypothetical protein [Dolichospermum sp. UHCC 0259]MTJ48803.1 hypothetical protein [Dolichospermum sp. UHCC 0259]
MEPISLILTALIAGATAATKDTASEAVKDAYKGLKALIKKKFAEQGKDDPSTIIEKFEKKPEVTKPLLEDELKEAGLEKDEEILKAAEAVMTKKDPEGASTGKYDLRGAKAVQIGNYGTQNNIIN